MDYCLDELNASFERFWGLKGYIMFLSIYEHENHLDNLKLWYKTFLNGLKSLKCIPKIFAHSNSIFKEMWGLKSWFLISLFLTSNGHLNNFVLLFETCWNSSRWLKMSLTCFDILQGLLQAKMRFKVSIFKSWVHWA